MGSDNKKVESKSGSGKMSRRSKAPWSPFALLALKKTDWSRQNAQEECTYFNWGSNFSPDLFTCNVLGQSFEFYLDNNNQPHFVELTDWTIEYFRSEQKFILKDSQGLVYEFGGGLLDATGFGENHSGYYTEITSSGIDVMNPTNSHTVKFYNSYKY